MPKVNLPARKPRLLWANVYCLLDTSSGASMAVREMLLQMVNAGYEVQILGAAVFDHERGTAGLRGQWPAVQARQGSVVALTDGPLEHRILVTAGTQRGAMTCAEERAWLFLYRQALDLYRPDVVFYYGGQPLDFLIAAEARSRGVPVAFYLANGTYTQSRWCRDVDLVLTDSLATVELYTRRLGVAPVAVGTFIDPARVLAPQREPRRILFVNPSLEKGVAVVIRLALLLEQRRPDIVFEVVESRGNWGAMLSAVSAAIGQPREALANVIVTAHTHDMRPVYARARLLLAPSLCWESAGRVLVEAQLNGIPAIITDHGGMPEMVQDAGVTLKLEAVFHEKPYTRIPPAAALEPLVQRLVALYDDESDYARLAAAARRVGQTHHRDASTRRLLLALKPLVAQRAGDNDAGAAVRQVHRHGLDDRCLPLAAPQGPPETPQQDNDTP
jgi:glycosyltransferase involved in cell wall biosynthesis